MSKYKPYPKYKKSGVEWLGDVPEGWKVKRLKHIAKVNLSNVDKKSKDNEQPILLCNYTDVYYNDFITSDLSFMKATAKDEQIKKFSLEAGDVIITKDSEGAEDIAISTYVPETLTGVICGYHLAQIKPKNFNGNYLFRAFNSNGIHDQFKISANGITRYAVGKDAISNAFFPVPKQKEQKQISIYLDQKTQKIDTLIKKQQTLIKLLKEKRQALISHAVTKGLDDSVDMKDSGVEWLGNVPNGWKVSKLRYYLNGIKDGTHASHKSIDIGKLLLSGKNIKNGKLIIKDNERQININEHRKIVSHGYPKKGDLLISVVGTIGQTCIYTLDYPISFQRSVCFLRSNKYLNIEFLEYVFNSSITKLQLKTLTNQSTIGGVYMGDIVEVILTLPPLKEQKEIANYLDQKTQKIDTLISKSTKAIELLKERRIALISAVVTGKVDVRD